MSDLRSEQQIKGLLSPFLERNWRFEYTYQKGGDSSCVYIYRFIKDGTHYFEWRETSGTFEIHLFVCVNGEYRFPDPTKKYKKQSRAFWWKHLFSKASVEENRDFFGSLLRLELENNPTNFYGIDL
jgi:hypothetical protein